MPTAACQASPSAPVANERSPAGLEQSDVTVRTASGKSHRFTVEVARTQEQQAYGLMNRASMAPDHGMLFPYDPPQPVAFWMKDTLIPLDIIFISPGGRILRIEANTVPYALDLHGSGEPVEAVLELNGGRAAELGIAAGDEVQWQR